MRPLELRLRNFRSYFGQDVAFDFRGRRLVGIVGPIGSGKSSILDGIAYALYAKTPTVGRSTKTLIHQRADAAAVALRFTVNDQVWEVVRSLRRRGQSQHALYRLEADTADSREVEKITTESDVNARIVELLGLEFDAFGRSVLLAQGRFAEFLSAPPRERDKVLKGVFGHDRIDAMREVAKEQSRVAAADADKVAFQVEQLERKAERLVAARTELVALEQRTAALEKAEPELVELDEEVAASSAAGDEARSRRTLLAAVARDLPDPAPAEALLEAAEKAAERRAASAAAMAEAREALARAETALAALERDGARQRLDRAAILLAALEQRIESLEGARMRHARATAAAADAEANASRLDAALTSAAEALTGVEAELAVAAAGVESARADLHRAEHDDMAAALRAGLSTGAACPVCDQTVVALPAASGPGDVEATRQRLESAMTERSRCEEGHRGAVRTHQDVSARRTAATDHHARLVETAAEASVSVEEAANAVETAEAELSELLGVDKGHADEITARRRALSDAADAAAECRKAVERSRQEHDDAIEAEQRAHQNVSALRITATDVAARLEVAVDVGSADIGRLRTTLQELREAWEAQVAAADAAAATAEQVLAAAQQRRTELLAELELVTGSLSEELGSARARSGERAAEIDGLEAELQAAEGLIVERDALIERRDLMQRLATDLTDSRFIRFLLDEERAVLSELGTQHLLRLTNGRYEFNAGGAFDIVDLMAADAVRKPDSLSGGETFLASLALALALAEMVARTGGRLDAFFLDEGFGSLDPEHLDLAMEGIESLVADGKDRLVVVVSHVPELRHRLEDLIELDRSSTTGDTRVVRA
jgi:exonuclease SbcC